MKENSIKSPSTLIQFNIYNTIFIYLQNCRKIPGNSNSMDNMMVAVVVVVENKMMLMVDDVKRNYFQEIRYLQHLENDQNLENCDKLDFDVQVVLQLFLHRHLLMILL